MKKNVDLDDAFHEVLLGNGIFTTDDLLEHSGQDKLPSQLQTSTLIYNTITIKIPVASTDKYLKKN